MIASAKLAGKMVQAPQVLTHHNLFVVLNIAALVIIGALSLLVPAGVAPYFFVFEIFLGICFGILLAIRIGGADMPVLISSLNATAGLAASLCGMVIENQLLIAFGATVAASGSILTYVMCKAMNRKIGKIIFPDYKRQQTVAKTSAIAVWPPKAEAVPADTAALFPRAVTAMRGAKKIIIVPGYGMALAKAQQEVATLAQELTAMGKDVKYAIHPVAGRMPGHMNVLLAEAGIDYDMLVEMEVINPDFHVTDLVIVVGACDVVNPAAIKVEGTPISGMPILMAHEAKKVICCNFDRKPGYSGVDNTLVRPGKHHLFGGRRQKDYPAPASSAWLLRHTLRSHHPRIRCRPSEAVAALAAAKSVVIIPGYGMALAKAQFKLVELAALLEQRGASVKYAIHPVAGRMPGPYERAAGGGGC